MSDARGELGGAARRLFFMNTAAAFLLVMVFAVPVAVGLSLTSRAFKRLGRGWRLGGER